MPAHRRWVGCKEVVVSSDVTRPVVQGCSGQVMADELEITQVIRPRFGPPDDPSRLSLNPSTLKKSCISLRF
jgi:hypothetical protein